MTTAKRTTDQLCQQEIEDLERRIGLPKEIIFAAFETEEWGKAEGQGVTPSDWATAVSNPDALWPALDAIGAKTRLDAFAVMADCYRAVMGLLEKEA